MIALVCPRPGTYVPIALAPAAHAMAAHTVRAAGAKWSRDPMRCAHAARYPEVVKVKRFAGHTGGIMIRSSRLRSSLVALFCAALLVASPMPTSAQPNGSNPMSIPIVGTVVGGGAFDGTFTLQRFQNQAGSVVAVGTLTGTLTSVATGTVSVARNITLPISIPQATCDILHLDLGPLDLNILGLQVDLSRIVLDIVAQPGPGNLLGNLLCAVAGLLDNPSRLAQLLNSILDILG